MKHGKWNVTFEQGYVGTRGLHAARTKGRQKWKTALGEVAQVCIGCSPNIASFLSITCKHGAPIDFKRDRIISPPAPPA